LLLVEILGVADGRDRDIEIAFHFIADVLVAVAVLLYVLANGELGMLQAVVGDGVRAEVRVRGFVVFVFCADRRTNASAATWFLLDERPLRERFPLELALILVFLFPI